MEVVEREREKHIAFSDEMKKILTANRLENVGNACFFLLFISFVTMSSCSFVRATGFVDSASMLRNM